MATPREVFDAAERSADELRAIVERENIPVTIVNGAGQTLAHIAAKAGRVDVVKYVLEKEPRLLQKKDAYNVSILHLAVVKGSLETVKYLVEVHNADICFLGGLYSDRTALHAAVEFNHLDILKYFVEERHIDFNIPNPKQTTPPIFLTAKHRCWDVIEYLVGEKNANVKLLNSSEENILFTIVRENFLAFMEYLLDEKKIEIEINWRNYYGETVVHVAANLGRLELLEYLVNKKNANVNVQKRTDRRTPLHYAAFRNKYLACKFLLEHGANPRAQDTQGDIAADKARDPRLHDYLSYAAHAAKRTMSDRMDDRPMANRPMSDRMDDRPMADRPMADRPMADRPMADRPMADRPPRSVHAPYSSIMMDSPPPFESVAPQISIGSPPRQAKGYMEGEESSFPRGSVNDLSYFNSFLFLAQSLTKRVRRSDQGIEIAKSFSSPASFVRSRMSSVAMDVIDGKTNFNRW